MVRFEDVATNYGTGPDILHAVSLHLSPGSFHFVAGPSGSGKSSLLRLMYLANRPSTGRMTLFGRDVESLTRDERAMLRRRIGVVFQDFRLLKHLSVAENVDSALVCIDRFAGSLPKSPALAVRILLTVVLLTAAVRNLPSPVRFDSHSLSGPLLRQLKAIDPDKSWKIGFSERRRLNYMGLRYYAQFDYKFQMAGGGAHVKEPGPFDIWICRLHEIPPNLPCLNYNYFKKFGAAVVVNTLLPNDKVTFNDLPLPDGNTVRNAQLIK